MKENKLKHPEKDLKGFLYNKENGFLIKYHNGKGIDLTQLNILQKMLEKLEEEWKFKDSVPKIIVFYLCGIVPSLYLDYPLYANQEKYKNYEALIYKLDTVILECLNPFSDDDYVAVSKSLI